MAELIDTAGISIVEDPLMAQREAVATIRKTLRKMDASDDEVDGALEALIELAKSRD
jgi:hypothetical protein